MYNYSILYLCLFLTYLDLFFVFYIILLLGLLLQFHKNNLIFYDEFYIRHDLEIAIGSYLYELKLSFSLSRLKSLNSLYYSIIISVKLYFNFIQR